VAIRKLSILAASLLLCAACKKVEEPAKPQPSPTPAVAAATPPAASYEQELEQWKAKRLEGLKGEDSWLLLIGLFWLKEGANRFGSDIAGEIVLPEDKSGKHAGSIYLDAGKVRLEANPEAKITSKGQPVTTIELKSDENGEPTPLDMGSLSFHVIKRGERLGLRVKDRENPARAAFKGTDYYPADRKWVVNARFEPYNPPKQVPILNVLGMETDETSPGLLAFEMDGRPYKLEALKEKGSEQFFIIFADQTNKQETYGAGRYLYADPPGPDGRVTLDFNRAYSPPCAFTKYATCPLPPQQNRLTLRVEAGERYTGH
jgi:uncharacterized protein